MSSGTQSPPLEATDSHVPMGVSSIDGTCSKPTKDVHQRAGKWKGVARLARLTPLQIAYFSDAVSMNAIVQGSSRLPYRNGRKVKEHYAHAGEPAGEQQSKVEKK